MSESGLTERSKESQFFKGKSFEDIGMEDLSEQEFQDVFDVVELLVRVENRLRSERGEALLEKSDNA